MGTPMLLIDIITIERILTAVIWSIIVYRGTPCLIRVILGDVRKGELSMASFALIGIGLLIFQWRALGGYTPVTADFFVAVALGSFCLSGMGVLMARIFRAPVEHQRSLITSHLLALFCLTVAGAFAA